MKRVIRPDKDNAKHTYRYELTSEDKRISQQFLRDIKDYMLVNYQIHCDPEFDYGHARVLLDNIVYDGKHIDYGDIKTARGEDCDNLVYSHFPRLIYVIFHVIMISMNLKIQTTDKQF